MNSYASILKLKQSLKLLIALVFSDLFVHQIMNLFVLFLLNPILAITDKYYSASLALSLTVLCKFRFLHPSPTFLLLLLLTDRCDSHVLSKLMTCSPQPASYQTTIRFLKQFRVSAATVINNFAGRLCYPLHLPVIFPFLRKLLVLILQLCRVA